MYRTKLSRSTTPGKQRSSTPAVEWDLARGASAAPQQRFYSVGGWMRSVRQFFPRDVPAWLRSLLLMTRNNRMEDDHEVARRYSRNHNLFQVRISGRSRL